MSRVMIATLIGVCLSAVVTGVPLVDDYPTSYLPGSGLFVIVNQTSYSFQNNSVYTLVGLTNFRTHELYLHNETVVLPSPHWQQLGALFFNSFERVIAFRRDTGDANGTYKVELVFFEYGPDRAPFSSRRFPSCVMHGAFAGHALRPFVLNGVAYVMDSKTGVVSFLLNSHRHENSTCQLSPTPATTFCAYPTTYGEIQWMVSSPTTLSFILGWGNAPFDPMLVNVKATGARGLSSSCYSVPSWVFPRNELQYGSAFAVDNVQGIYYFLGCVQVPSTTQLLTNLYEGSLDSTGGYNSTWRINPYWKNILYHQYGTLMLDARNATEYGGPLFCAGGADGYGNVLTCYTKYWQKMWSSSGAGPAFGALVGYDPLCV